MQSASSKIWTRVAVSISYYGNHYTTGTENVYTFLKGINTKVNPITWLWFEITCYNVTFQYVNH